MNVIPMIIFKSNLVASNYVCTSTYTDVHTDSSDNIIYHIPFDGKH